MTRYSRVAIVLHWIIAAAIIFQIVLGWRMGGNSGASTYAVFQLHKSIGITILLLSLARLAWRLVHRAPPHPADMPKAEKLASNAVHIAFYLIMIGLPITGWILVSAARINIPTLLYSTIPWPHVPFISSLEPEAKAVWEQFAATGHTALAWLTYGLVALHIGAVIKHQWLDKQALMSRMAGSGRAGLGEPRLWAALVALCLVGASATLYARPAANKAAPAEQVEDLEAVVATEDVTPQADGMSEDAAEQTEEETEAVEEVAKQPLSKWAVASSSANLGFTTSWSGEAINGRFGDWDADILFSPDDLANSRIKVTINTRSASTGDAQRDSSLPGTDFFDASSHPSAVFTANRIRKTGEERYVADGSLSLRGVSAPVSLPFRLKIDGDTARATGSANLDRTVFGVGQGMYGDTESIPAAVRVNFSFTATREK